MGKFLSVTLSLVGLLLLGPISALRAQVCEEICGQRPADICLMFDRTGSVSTPALDAEAEAGKALLDKFGAGDNGFRIIIGRFGDAVDGGSDAEIYYPAAGASDAFSELATLKTKVDEALASNSAVGTNIEDAIEECRFRLASLVDPNPVQVILLLTDGEANDRDTSAENTAEGDDNGVDQGYADADYDAAADAADEAEAAGMIVFTIAYDAEDNTSVTDRLLVEDMASGFTDGVDICNDSGTANDDCDAGEIATENGNGDNYFIALDPEDEEELTEILNKISELIECHDEDPCTKDECNEEIDCCEHEFIEGCQPCETNEDCNDGDACNGEETCGEDLTCDDGEPLNCDDQNLCTTDRCDPAGGCLNEPVNCNDDNPCTDDSCHPDNGQCLHANNTASCNDELFCNGTESCQAGSCVSSGDPCSGTACSASCSEDTNDCSEAAGNECIADENPCTDDVCDATGACTHPNDDSNTCDNDLFCDGTESCVEGSCISTGDPCSGTACSASCSEDTNDCSEAAGNGCIADENPCTDDVCDATGACTHPNDDSNTCDDDLFCDGTESCVEGSCISTGDPCSGTACSASCSEDTNDCSEAAGNECIADENPCTDDVCDATGACTHPNDDSNTCDDGNACTQTDACQEGQCTGLDPVICEALDQCHNPGECNPETGQCTDPAKENGSECNDEDACTQTDTCQEGQCVGGPPPAEICDDIESQDEDCDGFANAADIEDCPASGELAGCIALPGNTAPVLEAGEPQESGKSVIVPLTLTDDDPSKVTLTVVSVSQGEAELKFDAENATLVYTPPTNLDPSDDGIAEVTLQASDSSSCQDVTFSQLVALGAAGASACSLVQSNQTGSDPNLCAGLILVGVGLLGTMRRYARAKKR